MTDHSDSKDKVESLLKSSDESVLDGKKEETPKKEGQPLSKAVLKQIEYYFSNNNLWRDQALQTEIAKDPDGWVSVALVADFPRVKALSSDLAVVLSALRLSKKLELSGEKSLRRVSPVPPYNPQKDAKRTVYVDNLPPGSTLKSVRKLFAKFGRVTYVTKIHPIGEPISPTTDVREAPPQEVSNTEEITTALVEFAKKEAAKKAVALIQEHNEKNPVKTPSHLTAIRESKDQIILEEEDDPTADDAPTVTTSPEKDKSATPAKGAASTSDASTSTPTKTPVLDTLLEPAPARYLTTPSPASRGTASASTLSPSPATPYTPGSHGASPSTLSTPSTPAGAMTSPATPGSSEKKEKEIDMNNYTGFFVLTKLQYLRKIGFAVSSGSSTPSGSKSRTPRGKQGSGSKRRSSLNWRADKDEDTSSDDDDDSPEPQHTPRSRGTSGAGSSRTPSRQETRAPSRGEQRAASRGENRAASRGEVRPSSRGDNRTPSRGDSFFPRERQGSNSRPGSSHGYRSSHDRDRDRNRSGTGRRSSLDQNGASEYSRERGGSQGSMPSHRRARSHSQDLGLPPISDTGEDRTRQRGGSGGGDEGSRPILKLVSSRRASTGTVVPQRFAKGPDETGGFLAGRGAGRGKPVTS